MQPLRREGSLADVQEYVARLEAERGLAGLGLQSQCLKLVEEVGELAAAALSAPDQIPGECVDVLILLASVANRAGVSLHRALADRFSGGEVPALQGLAAQAIVGELAEADLKELSVRAAIETGELCRAVLKLGGGPSDPQGRTVDLAQECAALVLVVAAFAFRRGFDLAEAFRAKEQLNNRRVWR